MKKLFLASTCLCLCAPAYAQTVSFPMVTNLITINEPNSNTLNNVTQITSADGGGDDGNCLGLQFVGGTQYLLQVSGCAGGSGGAVNSVTANANGTLTISPTTGSVIAGLNLGNLNTWTAGAAYNLNAAALPTILSGTVLQLGGADAANARIEADTFAGTSFFSGRRAEGTGASPTATAANSLITNINALGYTGSAFTTAGAASVRLYSAALWTPTSTPTYIDMYTTPVGSLTVAVGTRFENDGGVTIPPTVTGGDKGAGTLNATTIYQAGVQVAPLVSPSFTTPSLGAATASTINGLTISSTTGTLTIAAGKTVTSNNTLTFNGTDGSTLNVGAGGTLGTNAFTSTAYLPVANPSPTGTLTLPDTTTWTSSGLSALTITGLASAGAQCVQVSSAGLLSGTGSVCGSGGGGGITALTGDVTASGTGSVAATLASVNAGSGSVGSSTAIPVLTTNAKGLVTTQSTAAVVAPAGTLSGTALASSVVNSSLTTLGTLTSVSVSGTSVFTSTSLAAQAAGQLQLAGIAAAPTLTTTGGQGLAFVSSANGLVLQGFGSASDFTVLNKAGVTVMSVTSNNTLVTFAGNIQTTRVSISNFGFITAPSAGQLQFGPADGNVPTALTWRAQSVVAGNSNTAGVNTTIDASTSTGSGIAGDFIFQTGGTGAAATAQNAYVAALTLKGATQLVVFNKTYTVSTLPTGIAGAKTFVTDQLTACAATGTAPTGGGSVMCPVFYSSSASAWVGG